MQVCVLALILLATTAIGAEAQKPHLISGYDDVLRQAENTSLVRSALRTLSKDETFAGMPELYRSLSDASSDPGFTIVSATSSMFADGAREFLQGSGYPQCDLYFRSWLTQWSAERFKLAQIEKLFSDTPARNFIIVFDNSETSQALSIELLQKYPTEVSAIYLRETIKREAPKGTFLFITAFDIAQREFSAGRLTQVELAKVATAISQELQPARVIPEYAYCPVDYDACSLSDPAASRDCAVVRDKVRAICQLRSDR
jgi:phosphatidate phosphatase APP1